MKFLKMVLAVSLCIYLAGCGKTSNTDKSSAVEAADKESTTFQPFYIYTDKGSRENHYVPSGFMPDSSCTAVDEAWKENCYSGETCIKFIYDLACSAKGQKWAGVYWLNPANNWGQQKGGFDLTGATKLTFWARGESGQERIHEFILGGITGNYPDSTKAILGPVILTSQWKEYTIDLRGKDLSYISGGFAWSADVECQQGAQCIFYLDDIRFE